MVRLTLLSLLSLAGTALASHQICYMRGKGPVFEYTHVVLTDESDQIINQSQPAASGNNMDVFEHYRGSVSVNHKLQVWSAKIHGQDWGSYPFHSYYKVDKNRTIWFGCYDTSNNGYCKDKDEKYKKCAKYIA